MLLTGPRPAFGLLHEGRYLAALDTLTTEGVDRTGLRVRALNAVDPWDTAWQDSGGGEAFDLAGHPAPPLEDERLAEAMRSRRVVVLMESHRAPETVRLGARLLGSLKAAGATHLAFEANFQEPLDRFQASGCLRPDTTGYSFDPAQASLLRTARSLGLQLIAIDISTYRLHDLGRMLVRGFVRELERRREECMAENVMGILKRDPAARVVVWTGEQHAMKRSLPGWNHPYLAAHLTRLLGEEPFCAGQHAVDLGGATAPRLLAGTHPWAADRGLDTVILHHRTATPACPAWLQETLHLIDVEPDGAALVQAIPQDECAGAVPADQRLTHGRPQRLLVERGRYTLRGTGPGDQELWRRPLTV